MKALALFKRLLTIDPASHHSVMILGPRGTGKTHWIKQHFPRAIYFDLLDDETYAELLAQPTRLAERIPSDYTGWVIIDEIQKVPALLNEVHRQIENFGRRFILTGSSARKLRRRGVNLLAGRALIYHMHPLTSYELGDQFDLKTALTYGLLPAIYGHENPKHYLSSYIGTYLKEEVLQEGLSRNLALFTRFLETASFSQGEVINYTNIAHEVNSNRHTMVNFFEILEDLLIAYRLPVFTRRAKRDVIAHPKFYYFDVGIYRTLRPRGPLDIDSEIDGPALETLFLQQIKAINEYDALSYQIYYWRTRTQLEVDFVLYGERGFYAFEIKRKNKIIPKDLQALRTFHEDYKEASCYLVYGGTRSYIDNDIHVVPFLDLFQNLRSLLA